MKPGVFVLLGLSAFLNAAEHTGSRVLYVGGTVAGIHNKSGMQIDLLPNDVFQLSDPGHSLLIPYKDVTILEYGVRVNRRYVEAALISPVFLVAKRKTHFLTIGYLDAEGKRQAIILKVGKEEIRPLLVSLEARTGRRIEFQDEEARKAGKG